MPSPKPVSYFMSRDPRLVLHDLDPHPSDLTSWLRAAVHVLTRTAPPLELVNLPESHVALMPTRAADLVWSAVESISRGDVTSAQKDCRALAGLINRSGHYAGASLRGRSKEDVAASRMMRQLRARPPRTTRLMLAKHADVSVSSIRAYELGLMPIPAHVGKALAPHLGVDWAQAVKEAPGEIRVRCGALRRLIVARCLTCGRKLPTGAK